MPDGGKVSTNIQQHTYLRDAHSISTLFARLSELFFVLTNHVSGSIVVGCERAQVESLDVCITALKASITPVVLNN